MNIRISVVKCEYVLATASTHHNLDSSLAYILVQMGVSVNVGQNFKIWLRMGENVSRMKKGQEMV